MFDKGTKKGTVRFTLKPAPPAKQVMLAGDFNEWKPVALKKQKDGSFAVVMPLRAGVYEYKYIVDGQWVVDPDNSRWALNPYGTLNSVAQVE